jgi:hypothetical protein
MNIWTRIALILLLGLPVAIDVSPARAQQVGVNSAVNVDANGTPPDAATRQLAIGQKVVHREHIVTDAGGSVQILFLDESAMTIGPNADLTIDEFVYDPNTGRGQLAMSATRGVMRFVGGKLSKLENAVTMQTPVAAIGIRGGIFVMDLRRDGALDTVFVFGKGLSITGVGGVSQIITRPGFGVSVAGRGAAPTIPAPASSGRLAGMLAQLSGKAGANGGAKTPPTDANVASSGISSTISGNVATSVQAAAANQPTPSQAQLVNVGTVQTMAQINTVASQGSPVVQQAAAGTVQYTDGFTLVLSINGVSGLQPGFMGTLANGQLTVPAQGTVINTVGSFPLAPGQASFGPAGTDNGHGMPLVGTTFLVPDRSAFYASVSEPGNGFGTPMGETTFLVGGVPTVTLPTTGIGTYSGSAIGGVLNNGATYTASGGFSASYNFGSQVGTATISNFDGKTFGGPIAGAGANNYAGALSGSGVTGAALGKFFGPAASSTGGVFAVTGQSQPYTAVGVFAGSQH